MKLNRHRFNFQNRQFIPRYCRLLSGGIFRVSLLALVCWSVVTAGFGQAVTVDKPFKEFIYLGSKLVAIEAQPAVVSGPQAPSVISGVPASPTGSPQTFTFTARDPNGWTDIGRIYFLVNPTANIPQNTCHGFYDRASNGIFLYNDALTVAQGPLTPGAAGNLQNSQCSIDGAGSSLVAASSTDLVINLKISLSGVFATTTKQVYLWVVDNGGLGTGWVATGSWLPNSTAPAAPTIVSGTPIAPAGSPHQFTFTVRDTNGYADISKIYFLVNPTPSIPQGTCHGFYDRASNGIFLYNDALSVLTGPLTPGTAGMLQNSQCSIDGAGSSLVAATGTELVIRLKMSLIGVFSTAAKSVYLWGVDNGGLGTGWIATGTWLPSGPYAPAVISGTPTNAGGSPQAFTIRGRDQNGYADISRIYFLVNATPSTPQNTCHGFYDRASDALYLYNDATNALLGPLTPGAGVPLQNSQCILYGVGSSLLSATGSDLVLNLTMGLKGTFGTTTKNVYYWITDNASLGTGWIQTGTWSPN